MAVNTQWGELLVGAYHQRVTGAEVVSYNNRSEEQGDQMEADVIAVNTDRESGDQTVHVCEVVTHLDGGLYSGTPDGDDWAEYAENDAYQKSLRNARQMLGASLLSRDIVEPPDELLDQPLADRIVNGPARPERITDDIRYRRVPVAECNEPEQRHHDGDAHGRCRRERTDRRRAGSSVAPEPEHDDDAEQPDNHRPAEVVTEHPDDQRITHRRSPRR